MTDLPDSDTTNAIAAPGASWIVRLVIRYHLLSQLIIHTVVFSLSLLLAFLMRFDAAAVAGVGAEPLDWAGRFWRCLPFFLIVKLFIFWKMRLFRGGWRYASIRDITNILLASWWFVLIGFVLWMLFYYVPAATVREVPYLSAYFTSFPRSVLDQDLKDRTRLQFSKMR